MLLTRDDNRALVAVVEAAGATALEHPLVAFEPTHGSHPTPEPGDCVLYTSAQAVRFAPPQAWPGVTVGAVGPGTAARLAESGRSADLVAPMALGTALVDALRPRLGHTRVWLPQAAEVPGDVEQALRRAGAEVHPCPVYRNICPATAAGLAALLPLDLAVLASGSAARRFAALGGAAPAVVIGPSTARACRDAGLQVLAVADPHTEAGLCAALALVLASRSGGG